MWVKYFNASTASPHFRFYFKARNVAIVIGQAFSAAYKQFLRSNGISEEALEQAEYAHILNAQTMPHVEVESFNDRNKTRKVCEYVYVVCL